MSFYRIKYYGVGMSKPFQHLYFPRRRGVGRSYPLEGKKDSGEGKRSENLARARRTVRDLILCNYFDFFCTFTFDGMKVTNRYDWNECSKAIRKAFDKYRQNCSPDFRYLIVPEFHKDGAVHFHGMVRGIRPDDLKVPATVGKRVKGELVQVPNTKGYVDWTYYSSRLGFFSCSRVKNYEACAAYVAKYITKDMVDKPLGRRMFFHSSNLRMPELIFDEDDVPLMVSPDFESQYVLMAYADTPLGLLPDWWGDGCAELRHPEPDGEPTYDQIFFRRLTGRQLSLLGGDGKIVGVE